ncbi:MAG: nucleotidyltransferase domain-containing protein [Roseiflexaceae bacterium]|nr:nucleotidyltransferase domain-containing protein [Roseiflexus sp.]MDW8214627.1 nucleotidyltransferase domain-containing protein [Roseiflexaceae bacterium]
MRAVGVQADVTAARRVDAPSRDGRGTIIARISYASEALMSGIDLQTLRQRIAAIAAAHPQVRLVYLFGSRASGEVGPLSDIDLAVALDRDAPIPHLRSELAHRFAEALDDGPVDLIVLNQAPIELAYAVIAEGRTLYQRSLAERVEYEADVMSRYGDYLPVLRAQRQDIVNGVGDERRVQRYREAFGRTQRTPGASDPIA